MPAITFSRLKAMTSRGSRSVDGQEETSQDAHTSEDPKRNRHTNWRMDEVKALVDAIEPVYEIISCPHSPTVMEQEKQKQWQNIQSKVNAVSTTNRTIQACTNKWSDYKSRAKVRNGLRQLGKTGGGEAYHIPMDEVETLLADMITSNDKKVMRILGATCLFGVRGGLDTSIPVPETVPGDADEGDGHDSLPNDVEVLEDDGGPSRKKQSLPNLTQVTSS